MKLFAAIACTSLIFVARSGFAANIDTFTLTDGSNTASFSLPGSPTPDQVDENSGLGIFEFTLNSVPVDINGTTSNYTVSFFSNSASLGGVCISTGDTVCNGGDVLNQQGPILFSGTDSAPTFTPGIYSLTDLGTNSFNGNFTLTIAPASASPVPEPSSLLLLSTGGLGLAGAVRRKLLG